VTARGLTPRSMRATRPATDRRGLAVAALLVLLQLALIVARVVLSELGRSQAPFSRATLPLDVANGISQLVFAAVGLLIVARRPGNVIGWLFLLENLGWAFNNLATAYVEYATAVAPLPAVQLAAWLTTWPGTASLPVFVLLILLFPDGRPPSRRWAGFAKFAIAFGIVSGLVAAFAPGPSQSLLTDGVVVANPLGVGGPAGLALASLANFTPIVFVVVALATMMSMVRRLRRSVGLERQQLKWLAYAVVLATLLSLTQLPVLTIYPSLAEAPLWARLLNLAAIDSFGLIAIGAAIAILRYRLYDIDRIISRTVSYAVLTAVLAAVYMAGFLGLQALLAPFTSSEGPVAVATSTLVVFALFQPVRRRIQSVVDRRFNRARYDGEREVERFAAHVRDEVEVDRVTDALAATLQRTMQPASAALWLRAGGKG
jgi:hypothetical protein